MLQFIVWRLVQLPIILWVVLTLTFFMCLAIPGDPVQGSREMTEETKRAKRAEFQLDEPALVQYAVYLNHLCPLELGNWMRGDRPVWNDDAPPAPAEEVDAEAA